MASLVAESDLKASTAEPRLCAPLPSPPGYKTVRNRCSNFRVGLGERTIRCVSFFAEHPSMCPEDQWHPHHIGEDFVLIDSMTLHLMSECESQFLVDPESANESEPTIIAVEMRPRRDAGRPKEGLVEDAATIAKRLASGKKPTKKERRKALEKAKAKAAKDTGEPKQEAESMSVEDKLSQLNLDTSASNEQSDLKE